MQRIVYGFCKFSANALNLHQIIDPGARNSLKTTKLAQELPAFLGPQAWDLFEFRRSARFRTALSMAGNRKAMRLVTNLLDQEQRRGIGRQCHCPRFAWTKKLFGTRSP